MSPTTAISKFVRSYQQVHQILKLQRTTDSNFFGERQYHLTAINEIEKQKLDQLKQRYSRHSEDRIPTEATVLLLVIAPLLELVGFYDPPFMICAEESIEINLEEQDEILKGRVDIVVVKNDFWILVVEAKNTQLNAGIAIPQCLTYMSHGLQDKKAVFGMVSNGEEFAFIKLQCLNEKMEYDVSKVFSLLPLENELYDVLAILKNIAQSILE